MQETAGLEKHFGLEKIVYRQYGNIQIQDKRQGENFNDLFSPFHSASSKC